MKTTHIDERELNESLFRHAIPAFAWAALFTFFAVAGALSREAPTQMADAAPALRPTANEIVAVPAMAFNVPSASAQRDAAVVAHEAVDPVGVGLNTTQ